MHISVLKTFLLVSLTCTQLVGIQDSFLVIEKPRARQQLSLAIVHEHEKLSSQAHDLKKLLVSTGVIECTIHHATLPTTQQHIIEYMHKGFNVVLFIEQGAEDNLLNWRLYDATQATMLMGKNTGSDNKKLRLRLVADAVYQCLFNHPSYFLTRIAYIKKVPSMRNKKRTELCTVDPAEQIHTTLLQDNRILVAPEWAYSSQDSFKKIYLHVSEFTPHNVRLLGVDLLGSVWPIIDASGTCVGTVQQDDSTFVYVRSGALWLYEFNKQARKGSHTKLTDSSKTCACPSLLSTGDIIYSCNNKIYCYSREKRLHTVLPISGSCISPAVHARSNRIIFSRSVDGILQIYCVDVTGKNLVQLTYGPGSKKDACWSPCGNYIAYTLSNRKNEQIALFNLMTGVETILTSSEYCCGYPTWSKPCAQLFNN